MGKPKLTAQKKGNKSDLHVEAALYDNGKQWVSTSLLPWKTIEKLEFAVWVKGNEFAQQMAAIYVSTPGGGRMREYVTQ